MRAATIIGAAACAGLGLGVATPAHAQAVALTSPGLATSRVDATGRLVEDWGVLAIWFRSPSGQTGDLAVKPGKVGQGIAAAVAVGHAGTVNLTNTTWRAPAFPAGLDVVEVRLENSGKEPVSGTLGLTLPEGAYVGRQTVGIGGRTVVTLPAPPTVDETSREWGFADESSPLPGWARPSEPVDPAFNSVRAGMGGVPIVYRFTVAPRAARNVVLGLCESHWATSGQRPLVCMVEGAPPREVDPVAQWGQHKPGVLSFAGRDANGDGKLDVTVTTTGGAPDQNPILNVIWLFNPGPQPNLEQVMKGRLNLLAERMVDCGGPGDQSLLPSGKAEFPVSLAPGASTQMTFLVACAGATAPVPGKTAWTVPALRKAASDVARGWRPR